MKKTLLIISTTLIFLSSWAQLHIVPLPQQITEGKGSFSLSGSSFNVQITVRSPEQKNLMLDQLKNKFTDNHNAELKLVNKSPDIWIGNPELDADLKNVLTKKKIWPDNRIGDQGYILHISKDQILIAGNTDQGIFYGVQSLKQLIKGSINGSIPSCTVIDWPAMAYRGVMDDISRGPVPHMEFMKMQIVRFSELKINMMSFYIEHIVKTMSHGDFAPAGGAISIKEWEELSGFAKNYHVELIGSFQTLGHFEKILSFPQYAHLGETNRMLSPILEESADFLTEVIGEMLPAFSSGFFNINGDEAWDLSRGNLKKLADSIGIARIYAGHMNRIIDFIKSNNKRVMMWGDIMLQNPDVFKLIPDDVMILTWDYSAYESFSEFIDPINEAGLDFIVCPGVLNSNRSIPDYRMTVTNIRNFVNEGYQKGAKGVLNTVWDDGGLHAFSRDWYGVAFGADQSWNPNNQPLNEFDVRFSGGIYGDHSLGYTYALHKINELTEFAATQGMNNSVFSNQIIPARNSSLTIDMSEWSDIEIIAMEAKSYLDQAEFNYYAFDIPFLEYTINQYLFLAKSRKNLINASQLYSEACIIQNEDPEVCRNNLISSLELILESMLDLEILKNHLRILWLKENKIYWYDHAVESYQKQINDFKDVVSLLEKALEDYDKGNSLPSPSSIRLSIIEKEGRYFQYWLICGPFDINNEYGPKPDFLIPVGGESQAAPYPGLTFTGLDGVDYMWDKFDFPMGSEIDLKSVFEKNTNAVVYAYCQIESLSDKNVKATFGSNDGIVIYCNGEKLYGIFEKRSLIPDEDEVILPLKTGKNHLLLKIDQWKGDWGFSFRLPDEKVRNHKQKYRLIEKP